MILQILFSLCIGLAVVCGIILAVAARCLFCSKDGEPPELPLLWQYSLSPERYRPMLRLLDEADFRFLREQPGFTLEQAAKLRAQRYRLFLAYLESLRSDFDSLAAAFRFALAHSDGERAPLASTLRRAEIRFAWRSMRVRARAYAWSKGFGKVDAGELLLVFAGLHTEVRSLAPHPGLGVTATPRLREPSGNRRRSAPIPLPSSREAANPK